MEPAASEGSASEGPAGAAASTSTEPERRRLKYVWMVLRWAACLDDDEGVLCVWTKGRSALLTNPASLSVSEAIEQEPEFTQGKAPCGTSYPPAALPTR